MRHLFLSITLLLVSTLAHAGGWTQKQGGYYVKASLNFFSTTEEFNLAGERKPLFSQFLDLTKAKFSDTNLNLYAEVGVMDWWTLVFTTAYKNYSSSGFNTFIQQNFENKANGIGDIIVGSRFCLLSQPIALALQPMVKLPTGETAQSIPLGTGKTDYEMRLQVGTGIPLPVENYVTADIGYTKRGGEGFSDELPYFAELGISPFRGFTLKMAVDGRKSVKIISNERTDPLNQNVLIVDQDFTRLWGGIIYNLTPSVEFSIEVSTVVAGKNTVAGETVSIGFALKPEMPL
jgi:hypothetical protein